MQITLKEILEYKNAPVVKRFQKDHPEKANQAEQIFEDLLTFFWASHQHTSAKKRDVMNENLKFVFIMDEEMREIDQMWHVFLLYTKDYRDFCHKYFREFLDHLPDVVPTLEKDQFHFEENLEKFLNYSFDLLGEDVVRRWFATSCAA